MSENNDKIKHTVPSDDKNKFERELADDAAWKKIQQNTFTKWINQHLKTVNKHINNLETDLSDGIKLINLLEVLTKKKLPKYHEHPLFRSQRLENNAVALKFLMNQGINIVNIDSSDIVDCNLKLILGLIYTLILHYSISMKNWELESEKILSNKNKAPKQRLLNWIQLKIKKLSIDNFTSNWNNGKAIGALVDAVCPGLCPDWQEWHSNNALENVTKAMNLANNWLNIPLLISPEEMINPNIDEFSMMTYLSEYHNAKVITKTPSLLSLISTSEPMEHQMSSSNPAAMITVLGPGIETSVKTKSSTHFNVNCHEAGSGKLDVKITRPDGYHVPINFTDNKDGSFTVDYCVPEPGVYKVDMTYDGIKVDQCPNEINVLPHVDISKIKINGLETQLGSFISTEFTIDIRDLEIDELGGDNLKCIITDSSGLTIDTVITKENYGIIKVCYTPLEMGQHSIDILWDNLPVIGSPFFVDVGKICVPTKCKAYGPGVQRAYVNKINTFTIDLTGEYKLKIKFNLIF